MPDPKNSDKKIKIVIKKVNKAGEEAAHGGSWKVAYADFVTAMMAFFLLMWLISMTAPGKKQALANYFKFYNLFDKQFSSVLDKGYGMKEQAAAQAEVSTAPQAVAETDDQGAAGLGVGPDGTGNSPEVNQALKEKLKMEIESKLAEYKSNVTIDITKTGVRVEVMDNEGKAIFPLGSSSMNESGRKILKGISESIGDLKNNIVIEGHTDALSYSTDKYTNWELSTERASIARRQLQDNGINPDRIVMVAGYAAKIPLVKENPNDPRNRRISFNIIYR